MTTLSSNELRILERKVTLFKKRVNKNQWVYVIAPKTKLSPEDLAMIQSMYSRDPGTILRHLLEVAKKGASKFMDKFYVKYGHKSIGDCGSILIAYEGVSMLAAKAIQDSQLYAGQEASTRYIDFSNQRFISFGDSQELVRKKIMENWRKFYLKNLPSLREYLFRKYPKEIWCTPGKEADYERTINARSFDIMRGFLPAGATTAVAWWTSISHASDHLLWMRCHTLAEVRNLATTTWELLQKALPGSFDRKTYPEREEYKKAWYEGAYYLKGHLDQSCEMQIFGEFEPMLHRGLFLNRPKGQDLPWQIGEMAQIQYSDMLDFGSFRDQQRHRAVIQRQGLLTSNFGVHEWYMENLPDSVKESARVLINNQVGMIDTLDLNEFDRQYLYPMGMKIPVRMTGSLAKFVYFVELRAQKTVHPTLHANAIWLAHQIRDRMYAHLGNNNMPLYIDEEIEITLKRGGQTILRKES